MEAPRILTPVARKSSITPRRSKCSRVRTCKIAALDWLVGWVNRSIIRIGIFAFAKASAALRPTGPAPTIKTSSGLLICIDESGGARRATDDQITRRPDPVLQSKFGFSFISLMVRRRRGVSGHESVVVKARSTSWQARFRKNS